LYVDGFSHTGRYTGDTGEILRDNVPNAPTWGSPIIGILALNKAKEYAEKRGLPLETAVILTERETGYFEELKHSLEEAGVADQVVYNPPNAASGLAIADGQIVAIHGDFLSHLDTILHAARMQYTYSFILLDPWGPTGIPYSAVSPIVSLPNADVMINLMYLDLHRRQGYLTRAADVTPNPTDEQLLENYDEMFGSSAWRGIVKRIADDIPTKSERGKPVEEALVTHYAERLRAADSAIAVKHIDLEFPDQDRTMFYLYLTTHDPTGALALNEVLHKAKLTEHGLKLHFQMAKWIHEITAMDRQVEESGQLRMFDMPIEQPELPPVEDTREVDIPALAVAIYDEFQGQTKTVRQIYTALAISSLFAKEFNYALARMKKQGLAEHSGERRIDTPIRFTRKVSRR
jgi:three-Cys-motif partner protein